MEKVNYQRLLDEEIKKIEQEKSIPTLLLHSCCGPCSSYVLEYLSSYFKITVLYYNPNIYPEEEFYFRADEQERLIKEMKGKNKISYVNIGYLKENFQKLAKGKESEKEGGKRCLSCYRERLEKSAKYAKEHGFDYITTTLTISPHKNSQLINQIGKDIEKEYGVKYLFSDFKKKEGYKRSTELSKLHKMYRQDYCGCEYSKRQREESRIEKENPQQ